MNLVFRTASREIVESTATGSALADKAAPEQSKLRQALLSERFPLCSGYVGESHMAPRVAGKMLPAMTNGKPSSGPALGGTRRGLETSPSKTSSWTTGTVPALRRSSRDCEPFNGRVPDDEKSLTPQGLSLSSSCRGSKDLTPLSSSRKQSKTSATPELLSGNVSPVPVTKPVPSSNPEMPLEHMMSPPLDDPSGIGGYSDRMVDYVKKLKAERVTRRHFHDLEKGASTDAGRYEVLDNVKEWVHIKDFKTKESWYYNTETEHVHLEKPQCLADVQHASIRSLYLRDRAAMILHSYPPTQRKREHLVELAVLLRECDLCRQFDTEKLLDACQFMHLEHYGPNEAILWQDEDAENFYVLIRGKVGLWKQSTDATAPKFAQEICETGGPIGAFKVDVLSEGKGFGEIGLPLDQPRNTSIITEGHCEFAVVHQQHFREVLKDLYDNACKSRCDFLEHSLPVIIKEAPSFENIERFFKEKPVSEGTKLCESGEMKDALDLIYEGSCKVFGGTPRSMLAALGKGHFVGIPSILMGQSEPHDVVCSSPVKVLRIKKADVFRQLPTIMREILAEHQQTRLDQYADNAKRAQVCSVVENLSKDLIHEAGVRRKSLGGENGDHLPALRQVESKVSTSASGIEGQESDSDSFGSEHEEQALEGLQRKLRHIRRSSFSNKARRNSWGGPMAHGGNDKASFTLSSSPDNLLLPEKQPMRRNSWGG